MNLYIHIIDKIILKVHKIFHIQQFDMLFLWQWVYTWE